MLSLPFRTAIAALLVLCPLGLSAAEILPNKLNLISHPVGYLALALFAVAYVFVVLEETLELRKSKPVMVAAALIWVSIALVYKSHGISSIAEVAIRRDVLEYSELLLFLIVSIAYVNAMEERRIFDCLRTWLVNRGYTYRKLFWVTGTLAFFISAISNNMTTAMLMCAVVMAVGRDNPKFVAICCVNTVVAVNSGGAFCPFGDITTLMVWQKRVLDFWSFFVLFIPSVVNFVIPAAIMSMAIPKGKPASAMIEVRMQRGAKRIVLLLLLTITTAVVFQNFLSLPAAVGMMAGLSYLQMFSYFLHVTHPEEPELQGDGVPDSSAVEPEPDGSPRFDVFHHLARMEWDTLLFFYGVVMCVGGLNFIGYLRQWSDFLYGELGATSANILVGIISALVDNIPVMFAILSMHPEMSSGQWLLVTLTAGVGGSLLSVGSAAGVALMGQSKGVYSFLSHLRWFPAIAFGYFCSIGVHFLLNAALF